MGVGVAGVGDTTAVARGELVGVGEAPRGRTGDWSGPGVDASGDAVGVGVAISRAKLGWTVMAKIAGPGEGA